MPKRAIEQGQISYSFLLKKIDLIEKTVKVYKREKKIDYDYNIEVQIIPSPSENRCICIMGVAIFPKNYEKEILAFVRLGFVFEIFELEKIAIIDGNSVSLPPGLLNLLNAVVIGTMRGVLFSELRGTHLEDAILPVLDPSKFQKET
jgi:hypothetical protein